MVNALCPSCRSDELSIIKTTDRIQELENQINQNIQLIHQARVKLEAAGREVPDLDQKLQSLKSERRGLLADGSDIGSVTKQIASVERDLELKNEEIIGLQAKIKSLEQFEKNLNIELHAAKLRVPQLRSVEIAAHYNKVAAELAGIALELRTVQREIDLLGQNQNRRCVFGPEIKAIPKVFFENDACELAEFMTRHKELGGTNPNGLDHLHGGFFYHELL